MKIVIFGLSISSAWGSGHATLLRGLLRSLQGLGHQIEFFEQDTSYYAAHRDATSFPFLDLHIYKSWQEVLPLAKSSVATADVAMITSYCPDGVKAHELLQSSGTGKKIFYDMDTPVTIKRFLNGENVAYLPQEGLGNFDLVLSYTGGMALTQLKRLFNAVKVAPLYGWVDPATHYPTSADPLYSADLSYLGTYASDRQRALNELFFEPARILKTHNFILGGAMFPQFSSAPSNVRHIDHVAPNRHSAFFCSSALSLNVTRASMAEFGYCPSGRLFESAACGIPILSDWWPGLETFFKPEEEILIARSTRDSIDAVQRSKNELRKVGKFARERVLDCHTADKRAQEFLKLIEPGYEAQTTEDISYKGEFLQCGASFQQQV